MSQLDIFIEATEKRDQAEGFGPDEFFVHPFGRVKAPANTGFNQVGVEELYKVISDAHTIARRGGIFSLFCDIWWAVLQRFSGGEAEYMRLIDGLDPELLELSAKGFAVLREHFVDDMYTSDILGAVFMMGRAKGGGGWPDQEFTPWTMVMLAAKMTMADLPEERLLKGDRISVNDPACGAGGQLLGAFSHVAEKYGRRAALRLSLSGQDIDPLCATMTKIQTTMIDTTYMLNLIISAATEQLEAQKCK